MRARVLVVGVGAAHGWILAGLGGLWNVERIATSSHSRPLPHDRSVVGCVAMMSHAFDAGHLLVDGVADDRRPPQLMLCSAPMLTPGILNRAALLGPAICVDDSRHRVLAHLQRFTDEVARYEQRMFGPMRALRELCGDRLSRSELRVARLAIEGLSRAEIATALGVSEATIKTHLNRVLAKCGIRGGGVKRLRDALEE